MQRPSPTFALFLREGQEWKSSGAPDEEPRLVAEYRGWAQGLRTRGLKIEGMKLDEGGEEMSHKHTVPYSPEQGSRVTGFFMIRARDLSEALVIARSCPHLSHGGEIEVRPIAGP